MSCGPPSDESHVPGELIMSGTGAKADLGAAAIVSRGSPSAGSHWPAELIMYGCGIGSGHPPAAIVSRGWPVIGSHSPGELMNSDECAFMADSSVRSVTRPCRTPR